MKNLFTKMVLVAVAAMGMLACQNEPETVVSGNDNAQKTTIEVIADLENTRSAFGEKDGNSYPSYWQGGEQVKAAVATYNSNYSYGDVAYYEVDESNVTTVTATGSVAQFSLTFDNLSTTSGTLLIASPVGSVGFDMTNYYYDGDKPGFKVNVPTEQTPLAASVDPAAHILTATYTGSFANTIKPEWEHAAAYAKMTLKNFDAEIDNVVVTIDSKKYTLNPDNVEGNVFWFACEANEAPSTVKVTVNTTDEKAYIKTLDLAAGNGMGLPFAKGNVAEFSVNMDGITPDEGGADVDALDVDYVLDVAKYTSGYWQFSTGSHGTAPYVRIYMNSNDMADNAFKTKDYTFERSNTSPNAGVFSINRYMIGSTLVYGSSIYGGSMTISIVNNQYRIVITAGDVNPITFGWEGVPDGWNAPGAGGGEEPEPEPEEPEPLAAPANLRSSNISATGYTVEWDVVANASKYAVSVNGGAATEVNDTSYTVSDATPDTTYTVSVVAKGDGTSYLDSAATTIEVTTLADSTPEPEPGGPIVLSSAVCYDAYYGMVPYYEFRTADGKYILKVAIYREGDRIHKGTYSFTTSINNLATNPGLYFTGGSYAGASTIDGVSWTNAIYTGSTITVVSENGNSSKHVIEFHIVTDGDNEYDFKYEGFIVDQRP